MDMPKPVKSWAAMNWALMWAPGAWVGLQHLQGSRAHGAAGKTDCMCWCCHFSFLSNASDSFLVPFLEQWASSSASEGLTCPPVRQMLQAAAAGGHFTAVAEALCSLLDQTMHFWRYQDVHMLPLFFVVVVQKLVWGLVFFLCFLLMKLPTYE